jgi:hypothetical protein
MKPILATPFRRAGLAAAAALTLALTLAGCASGPDSAPSSTAAAAPAAAVSGGAPRIAAPPTSVGTWQDLGYFLAPWMAGDAVVPVDGPGAPTRVAGLRREDGRWLAIVLVQTAPAGSAPCPAPNSLHVAEESGGGSCLRMRGDADFDGWLQQQHSVLYHWLEGRGWGARPRAWAGYRVNAGGRVIEAHALIDPTLLEPTTRNNIEFLAGGQPARQWARRFAAAARDSGGGALNVPPLPFAPQVALAEPPAPPQVPPAAASEPAASSAAPAPEPARATPPPPALPPPRGDRG